MYIYVCYIYICVYIYICIHIYIFIHFDFEEKDALILTHPHIHTPSPSLASLYTHSFPLFTLSRSLSPRRASASRSRRGSLAEEDAQILLAKTHERMSSLIQEEERETGFVNPKTYQAYSKSVGKQVHTLTHIRTHHALTHIPTHHHTY